jgi:signal transduction histidine kinase
MLHSEKTLRILNVETSEESCRSLVSELEKLNYKLIYKKVSSLSDLKSQLKKHHWNLVISNFNLEGFTASEALDVVKQHSKDLPFILFTECIGEEAVADMMKQGAEDIVLISRIERLHTAVKRILREHESKEKVAKAKKLATDAFAAKEQMLAIVSHDIKNPLSAIQLEAQMLLRSAERSGQSLLSEEVRIQANRILKTTDRLKILISDLLDKNKSENGLSQVSKANVDASGLVREVLDSMRPLIQDKDILLRSSLPPEKIVCLDRNKMFQVFSNLINNAIKFTPIGGNIHFSLDENDHEFIFSIENSGPGIEDKEINKLFEKYWTGRSTNCAGTGLGLFICKTIVEAHGGHIYVENISDGVKFKFSVPKVSPNFKDASFSFRESHKDMRKKIYIVDDDEDLREVISWALGKEGYAIHSFSSPQEALACLRKGQNLPNLIVVDFHMDEMKGSDFVLKKSTIPSAKFCPVVMISASPQDVEEELPHEFYKEIITKPIDLEGLVDNVRKFLN